MTEDTLSITSLCPLFCRVDACDWYAIPQLWEMTATNSSRSLISCRKRWVSLQLRDSFVRHISFQSSEGSKGIFLILPVHTFAGSELIFHHFHNRPFNIRHNRRGLLLQWMWLLCALVPTELICYPSSFQTGALQLSSCGCLVTSCPAALSGFFLLLGPWCGSAPEAWIILHDKATQAKGGVPCTPNTTTHCSYLALAFLRPWGLLLPCSHAGTSHPTALRLSGSPEALSW